ncbi:MAG: hypothetical protein ACRER4_04830 [Steroidobacteraceae bacterium]
MSALNRPAVLLLAALAPVAFAAPPNPDGFTSQFPIGACDFKAQGGNAFVRMIPRRQLYLSNARCVDAGDCTELVELWITMLPETRVINFQQGGSPQSAFTRVMEEFETVDGELEEVSRNYIADCNPMHDVYYFGEDVEDGDGNPLPDAWLAGVDGARPGILMPDRAFLLGSRYYQEFARNARDRSEHTSMSFEVEVPAGVFKNCVEITETTPLEPGSESPKTYCPNVGIVRDGDLELIAINLHAQSPSAGP